MRLTTPVLLATFATVASVAKISIDAFFPNRSRLGWKLLAAPVAATVIVPASTPAQQLEWTSMTFTTDAGEVTEAERAVISVPERHANPNGPQVKLPLIRFRSKAANPGPPVIYIAGGPGGSGLASAKRDMQFPTLMAFREFADVIVYDQRGTGTAEPSLALPTRFSAPHNVSITSEEARASFSATAAAAAKAIRDKGIDLAAYNTQESADDLESIRKAIGAPKISLWGHSYGSHLGLAYIKRHNNRVARVILGGVNGLDDRWRLPSESQTWIESVDALTKKDERLRKIMPDFLGTTKRALEKLEANPLRVKVDSNEVFIGAEEIRTLMVLQGGESDFVKQLPMIVAGLDAGQAARFAPAVTNVLRRRPLGTVMTYAMHISSGVSPERQARINREAGKSILTDAINYPWSDEGFRNAWGVQDLGAAYRAPVVSSVPALIMAGTVDGRTSVWAAREVKKGFRNSSFVLLDGFAHDIYTESPALLNVMTRFMRGDRVRDTTISIPVEFHSPDEPALIAELKSVVSSEGSAAAVARARQMREVSSGKNLTSYVMLGVAESLINADKKPADGVVILRGAAEIFPNTPLVFSRLGTALLATGDRTGAAAAFGRAVELNPFFRFSAVQLAKLEAGG
jgi:pimeloyl-ACP methyl ester carboxylesterase